jgi:serine protease Do
MELNKNKLFLFLAGTIALSVILSTLFNRYVMPVPQTNYWIENKEGRLVNEKEILLSESVFVSSASHAENAFVSAATKGKKAVVFIKSKIPAQGSNFTKKNYTAQHGSGVLITRDGYLVTNGHVIEKAEEIEVMLNNKQQYKAKIVGLDEMTDLAVLKIDIENADFLIFGDSEALEVGEWVLAIGNPFKLQSSVTAGIISALGRSINILDKTGIESFIQTDAAVQSGNSGGALINLDSKLIGINTAIMTEGGLAEGFSFAIPSRIVQKVVRDIIEFGVVQRAWLGLETEEMDAERYEKNKIKHGRGVYVSGVKSGGAAQKAGISSGDIILAINDEEINSVSRLSEIIGTYSPGDEVKIEFHRGGKAKTALTQLTNLMNTTENINIYKHDALYKIGLEIRDLTEREKSNHGRHGAMVVSVRKDTPASIANIEPGYIIQSVSGKRISNSREFIALLTDSASELELEGSYVNYPGIYPYVLRVN